MLVQHPALPRCRKLVRQLPLQGSCSRVTTMQQAGQDLQHCCNTWGSASGSYNIYNIYNI
jgi:hypothetical protein